jgi:hypothetical protein
MDTPDALFSIDVRYVFLSLSLSLLRVVVVKKQTAEKKGQKIFNIKRMSDVDIIIRATRSFFPFVSTSTLN